MRSSWLRPPAISTSVPRSRAMRTFLRRHLVVKADRRNLQGVVAIHQRAGGNRQSVRIGRDFKMNARERARGEQAVLIVGDEFDQQGTRFLVDRV